MKLVMAVVVMSCMHTMGMKDSELSLLKAVKSRCAELSKEADDGDVIAGLALCRFEKAIEYYKKHQESLYIKRQPLVEKLVSKGLIHQLDYLRLNCHDYKSAGYVPQCICKVMLKQQKTLVENFVDLSLEKNALAESLLDNRELDNNIPKSGSDSEDDQWSV